MKKNVETIFLILTVILVFIVELYTAWHKGLTYDEGAHIHYGLKILHCDSSRFDDSKMPVTALNALPIRIADILKNHWLKDKTPTVIYYHGIPRIPTIIFSLAILFVLYFWTKKIYSPLAAKIAVLLYAFCPNIIAHSSLITNDIYTMGAIFLSMITFYAYTKKRYLKNLIFFSLAISFALLSKFTCIFLFPLILLIILFRYGKTIHRILIRDTILKRFKFIKAVLFHFAIFAGIVLLILNAAYFFNGTFKTLTDYKFRSEEFKKLSTIFLLKSIPLPVPSPYIEGLDWVKYNEKSGETFGNIYLLGKTAPPGKGFKSYYFIVWLFKIPLGTQILFYIACLSVFSTTCIFRFLKTKEFLFLLLPSLYFFCLLNFVLKAQLGVRYLLICLPFIFIFTAGTLSKILQKSKHMRIIVTVLFLWNVISVFSYFPHFISYFNELSFDRKYNWKILADSNLHWGENYNYLKEFAINHPEAFFNPDKPVTGIVVVDVNYLTGIRVDPQKYAWLRENYHPIGHIAYTYIIYDTSIK